MKKREVTAGMLARILDGKIEGDAEAIVEKPARIENAAPGDVCFYANPKYEKYIYDTKATVLLIPEDFVPSRPIPATLIRLKDVYGSVAVLLGYFINQNGHGGAGNGFRARLKSSNSIHISARIGRGTRIHSQVSIGSGVKIGRNCIIHSGVKIYAGCVIGDGCIIHSNAVIGADGFGFAPDREGVYHKIPQLGNVVLEENVEIGAGTTVDRATMGSTIIHKGVKIDNLCMVAHNVEIGENTVMAAMSGIAGSTKVGKNCVIAGQVGISGHLTIADNTTITAGSKVQGSVRKPEQVLMGYPAIDYHKYMRAYAIFKNAPDAEK
ncbi:MAG: UDP-3-O-(3-hydroxymyristoyl)glucosamine N-acyltransferase [Bacteroidales bacterium]|nr:UDP-3-O-(3-hydroxymyristoyl)glucosamine N-acyltransferase [Candidatus Cacconaster equifaecalis]